MGKTKKKKKPGLRHRTVNCDPGHSQRPQHTKRISFFSFYGTSGVYLEYWVSLLS
jgi:hypothetical protein